MEAEAAGGTHHSTTGSGGAGGASRTSRAWQARQARKQRRGRSLELTHAAVRSASGGTAQEVEELEDEPAGALRPASARASTPLGGSGTPGDASESDSEQAERGGDEATLLQPPHSRTTGSRFATSPAAQQLAPPASRCARCATPAGVLLSLTAAVALTAMAATAWTRLATAAAVASAAHGAGGAGGAAAASSLPGVPPLASVAFGDPARRAPPPVSPAAAAASASAAPAVTAAASASSAAQALSPAFTPVLTYPTGFRVVRKYVHDRTAYTQGLLWHEDAPGAAPVLYESTGLVGQSEVRIVDVTPPAADGELGSYSVRRSVPLAAPHFGEGIVIWRDELVQLTWRSKKAFTYNASTLQRTGEFAYTTTVTSERQDEGWGITRSADDLIVSDGTDALIFWDPVTKRERRRVRVKSAATGQYQPLLNELEYVHGWVLANVWYSDKIAVIHAETGTLVTWIDCSHLRTQIGEVLNGVAYTARRADGTWATQPWGGRLWITGKFWDTLYEVELTGLQQYTPPARRARAKRNGTANASRAAELR